MQIKRREFLQNLGSAAIAVGVVPAGMLGCAAAGPSREFTGWTWVHGNEEVALQEWQRRFTRIRAAGMRGVLVSGGTNAPVEAARAVGLDVHRWVWILNRNGDTWAKQEHPEWFTVSRNGESTLDAPPYVGYYQWVCPTRAPVREYLADLVRGIASDPDIHGVHLDYIRHSDVILPVGLWSRYDLVQDREYPEFDFCYCDVCRETFAAQTGVDPMDLPDPSADESWREFRWNSVTELVRILAQAVRAERKQVTAAVFPTPTLARELVRQAWEQWPLDAFFPMLYHNFYNEPVSWIGTAAREGVNALPPKTPLYAGLYLPSLSPAELAQAVHFAREAGAAGVSAFEMNGLSDEHLAAFSRTMTRPTGVAG